MEQLILDFLEGMGSIDFQFVWQIFLYALVLFWIVVLYWVWLDSGDRTTNRTTRYLYVALTAILNVIGLIIYLIIRPGQTIEEIYWMDLERRYLKYETADLGDCPKCGTQLYPGYTYCPNCKHRLKIKCSSCNVYIERKNKYCPYCGEEARKRISPEQLAPTREVMQMQIESSRNEATEIVETNRTRYSIKGGLAVKVGNAIVTGYKVSIEAIKKFGVNIKEMLDKKAPKDLSAEGFIRKEKKGKKKKRKSHK